MKNHIKNYIKIMGLAAVPFGTAQVRGDGPGVEMDIRVNSSWQEGLDVKILAKYTSHDDLFLDHLGFKLTPQAFTSGAPSSSISIDCGNSQCEGSLCFCERLFYYEGRNIERGGANIIRFGIKGLDGDLEIGCVLRLEPVINWSRYRSAVLVVEGVEKCQFLNIWMPSAGRWRPTQAY